MTTELEMKEMIYTPRSKSLNEENTVLYNGEYLGYPYYIISYYSHPCAYIVLDETDKCYGKDYSELQWDIDCHGGLTYSEDHLLSHVLRDSNKWVIGWDYAHSGDLIYYKDIETSPEYQAYPQKKWTTREIYEEVRSVIHQLSKLNNDEVV